MIKQITLATDPPLEAATKIRVGLHTAPYLTDHGVQGMAVLPGSYYIDMALSLERELSGHASSLVRNVTFNSPIILSADDTLLLVEVRNLGDERVEFTFFEAGVDGDAGLTGKSYAARLEIDRRLPMPGAAGIDRRNMRLNAEGAEFSIEGFQSKAQTVIDSAELYERLRQNGNQYGPRFQHVSSTWRAGNQCLGRLSGLNDPRCNEKHYLHPSVLDSMAQLLAPFVIEKGKTFILRSIEKVELVDIDFPETLWGHATLVKDSGDGKGILGNVHVFDQSGKSYLELSGVAFTLMDRSDSADERAVNLVIASNFTAEPLEDVLGFWGRHFDTPLRAEFAPYNQVFQQLLDPQSAFSRNSDGVNTILLSLEEWAQARSGSMKISTERAEQYFGSRARRVLPNGLEIAHLNPYETDYVYKEIFEDECYLRHGIHLEDGDTVVDIGANIGLFSLFVMSRSKNPTIYSCEPAPVVYDLLKANCDAYGSGSNVHALNVGVSDRRKTATFTFYEKSSVFSGFHSDLTEDREAIQAVVRNILNESALGESVEEYVDELTADRLRRRTSECQLLSVSDIIRENHIDRIDLLKVDAEKSELDIIRGIDDHDWPKIKQIVVEIHDATRETIRQIEQLLIEKGYHCAVEHETLLEHSGLFNLYATRAHRGPEAGVSPIGPTQLAAEGLKQSVREFGSALRAFGNLSQAPLLLCFCPESPEAKLDARLEAALNEAEEALTSEAAAMKNIHVIASETFFKRYPVADYYDLQSHHAGHVPYTPEGFAAIGTTIVRTLFNLRRNPFKVVVLDCDYTLWKGVCGEDGPMGIEVSAPYRALQEFMIARNHSGMLLCLCSKNDEQNVLDVFDKRPEMPLKREHLVSWRINWDRKSENIKALAKELDLGLDSFIFVDDNPVECADVRIHCPEVLTLQLPQIASAIPAFLDHIWAFDHTDVTEEDKNRTRMYQENSRREQHREQSFSLKDFVDGLGLRVEIAAASDEELGRVAQLTMRTNQFNFTTVRRSENEIRAFLTRDHNHCLAVRVSDRFGDYGLVGVLMYESLSDRLKVDTFLLSCRVLGRGVEHAVVTRLGQMAVEEGKRSVEFTCLPTGKNLPALKFIASIGDRYQRGTGASSWILSAEVLADVEYDPNERAATEPAESAVAASAKPERGAGRLFGCMDWKERLQQIGENLIDIDRLRQAIDGHRPGPQPLQPAVDAAPGSTLEESLVNIWKRVLGRAHVGVNDNFFEVGGTSLKAVQVVAAIKRELNQSLSIVTLFECPTVRLLAEKLSTASGDTRNETATAAAERGQQRRYNTSRRKPQ